MTEEINIEILKRIYKDIHILSYKYFSYLEIDYYNEKESNIWRRRISYEELMHDLKIWLFEKGFQILSKLKINLDTVEIKKPYYSIEINNIDGRNIIFNENITDKSEVNAVIKTANLLWEFI